MANTSSRARHRSVRRLWHRSQVGWAAACWAAGWARAALGQSHPAGVPQLASRPGAAYTIYLDLDGFSFTGGWGGSGNSQPGVIPAYAGSVNGVAASDQSYITQIWSGIAEKYAAFNVNVTTMDPAVTAGRASTDATRQAYYDQTAQMMHTIIGDTSFTAAGVSFVGVDPYSYGTSDNNGAGDGFHTDFVTPTGTGGEFGVTGIVGAASHENGHGLGLEHQSDYNGTTLVNEYSDNNDAQGNGSVSPVMGVTYYSQRGVWRSGTSDSGNGTLQQQNDVAVIANDPNMGGLEDDGVGHTVATAALLPTTGTTVNFAAAHGVIVPASSASPNPIGVSNYTADVYAFNSSGSAVTLTVNNGGSKVLPGTADAAPTLASSMSILNSGGTVLYTAAENFATQTESITQTLPAGRYYVEVNSAGGQTGTFDGSTNGYYDMGSYFLTGTGVTGQSVGTYYWQGGASTAKWSQVDGTTSNWRGEHAAGADKGAVPGPTDNVFLSVDSGATNLTTMTLGGSRTINSLTFTGTGTTAATTGVTIAADGSTLTLAPYAGHIDASVTAIADDVGLVVQAGAAADAIAANVALALGQTWQLDNAAASPLTVSGTVSGTAGAGLTLIGGGRLTLTASNTYTGGTYVNGSTVTFAAAALGAGPVTLTDGGVAQFAAGNTTDLTTGGRVVSVLTGGGSIDTNGNGVYLAGGVADAHAGALTKLGLGTLTAGGTSNPSNLFVRGGTLSLTSGASYSTVASATDTGNYYSSVGQFAGDVAGLTVFGGATLTVAGDLNAGDNGGSTGTIRVLPSATVDVRTLYVGKFGTASGTVVQTGGTVQEADNGTGANEWRIGGGGSAADVAAVGAYNLAGGSLNTGGTNLQVGAYGTGTLTIGAGTATVGGFLSIGRFAGSIGTVDLSVGSGTLTANAVNELIVGEQGTGTLKVGGTSAVNARVLAVAQSDGTAATGTVLQSGGTVDATGGVLFGGQATGSAVVAATYTLGGGTLDAASLTQGTGSTHITGTFTFAGGTLAPTGSTTAFMQGLTRATVTTGGAVFNTGAYAVTVAQPLLHDATLNGADGGLTKLGTGTLRLSGAETYTGPTSVATGTLVVNGSLPAASAVMVSAPATLAGTGTVGGTVGLSGTITAGSGVSAIDTVGSLDTGVETWLQGSTYVVKLDATKAVTAPVGSGRSGPAGSKAADDELLMSNLSGSSTGLSVDAVVLSSGTLATGTYSFVIADATASPTAFGGLFASGGLDVGTPPTGASWSALDLAPDGSGGEDLLLDLSVTATPEPASLLLLGVALVPLALGRRRRRAAR